MLVRVAPSRPIRTQGAQKSTGCIASFRSFGQSWRERHKITYFRTVNAAIEKEAAFKKMDQINGDNIGVVATHIAAELGKFVEVNHLPPNEVVIGSMRASIAFWMGSMQDGKRTEGLDILRQAANEEVDNMMRAISNGLLPP
jgi:hypothetical protein